MTAPHSKPWWMVELDIEILEALEGNEAMKLFPLRETVSSGRMGYPLEYVLYRCRWLTRKRFIEYDTGRFTISETGRQFLGGTLDMTIHGVDRDEGTTDVDIQLERRCGR